MSAGSRAAVTSNGRMRSAVPWRTKTGISIFGKWARKSVNHGRTGEAHEVAFTVICLVDRGTS